MVPPTSPVPLPRIVTGSSLAFDPGSSSFSLATRQLFHSACSCRLSMRVPFSARLSADQARQRQVDIVAAQQDVLADGDALERQFAVAARSRRSA